LKRLEAARAFDENHVLMASQIVNESEFEKVVGGNVGRYEDELCQCV
jgi:hypothetical protein